MRNPIVSFAVAYQGYHHAMATGEGNPDVWQDMLVKAADTLGLQDSEMGGLRDHRDAVKRRDDEFLANYRASLDPVK